MRYRRLRVTGGTYFFTVVTAGRRPIFADAAASEALVKIIDEVRARHPFEIDAYVILPDHLHMIWSLPEGESDFSTRWMLTKSKFSRLQTSVPSPVWQNRFWEHLIRDDEDFTEHVEYIHYNPVKHGLVAAPLDWPHSSFHAFVSRGDYPANWGSDAMPKWPEDMARRSE